MARITPPPLLSISVDIGGTKVAAGVVDEQGGILDRWQEPTPSRSPPAGEDAILGAVGEPHRVGAGGNGGGGWGGQGPRRRRFLPPPGLGLRAAQGTAQRSDRP